MKLGICELLLLIGAVVCCCNTARAFSPTTGKRTTASKKQAVNIGLVGQLYMSSSSSSSSTVTNEIPTTEKGLLKRDRYVATNRFAVRKGQQAKFEKRWATRKSRLATLQGFKYFHLMRRVTLNSPNDDDNDTTYSYDEGETDEEAQENYVSFTIWNKKSDFSAWRSGEAFKEAHGGTSIGAFLSTMVNSALVLRGPPRPAFYDGLLLEAKKPDSLPETIDGWRNVEADGITTLPAECFVQMIKFFVPPGGTDAAEFEKAWSKKETDFQDVDGLVAFSLLRRDGQAKGHGVQPVEPNEPSYVANTIFKDRDSFESWVAKAAPLEDALAQKRAPEKVYYEGTLVISSAEGP